MAEQSKGVVDKAKIAASGAVDKAKGVTGSAVEKTKPLVDKAGDATISALDKAKGVTGTVVEKTKPLVDKAGASREPCSTRRRRSSTTDKNGRWRHLGRRRRDGRLVRRGEGGPQMVSAYILVQTEVGKASQVTDQIKALGGVVNADGVTGPYDVIARVEADDLDGLAKKIVMPMQEIEGITRTLTCPVLSLVAPRRRAMTIKIRRDDEISDVDGEWFRARWHFSFDSYRDPEYTSFGTLRVFNDDRLIPGAVWPMHPHRDIEGLTYVVEGSFRHQDDVGGAPGPLPAGSVQRMTLGSGAWHSEQNASETEGMRFIQIWILPAEPGLAPGVEQKVFTEADRTDRLLRAISGEGGDAVLVHQDAHVFVSHLNPGAAVTHPLGDGRGRLPLRDRGRCDREPRTDDHGRCGRDLGRAADRDRSRPVGRRPRSSWSTCSSERPASSSPPSGLRPTPNGWSSDRLT